MFVGDGRVCHVGSYKLMPYVYDVAVDKEAFIGTVFFFTENDSCNNILEFAHVVWIILNSAATYVPAAFHVL
jgi:hypothetical protein